MTDAPIAGQLESQPDASSSDPSRSDGHTVVSDSANGIPDENKMSVEAGSPGRHHVTQTNGVAWS